MRHSIAAMALITRVSQGQWEWLARWNKQWSAYHLVGGHKHDDETFYECVVREIAEELGLQDAIDFHVHQPPQSHLEYTAISRSAGEQTCYTVELFEVEVKPAAFEKVEPQFQDPTADNRLRWLNETEIRERRTRDGEPVSETMELLLAKAGLLAD